MGLTDGRAVTTISKYKTDQYKVGLVFVTATGRCRAGQLLPNE